MTENVYILISRKHVNYDILSNNEKEEYFKMIIQEVQVMVVKKSDGYKIFEKVKIEIRESHSNISDEGEGDEDESVEDESDDESIEGEGLINDSNYLLKRFKLLSASKQAGNNGVVNEISDIIKYLYETHKINKN